MDLEQLTKTQIILLTLLVSFVTSIATGIVTVTLVDQAPPAVTQTINRVVERTVERVVSNDQTASANETVTKEVQVIVKENDLITDAVSKVGKSMVRLYAFSENGGEDLRGAFLGLGFIISRDGLVVTDATLTVPGATYVVETADKVRHTARIKNESASRPTSILELSLGEGVVLPPVALAPADSLELGQIVLTLSGRERDKVGTGITSDIVFDALSDEENPLVTFITTDINDEIVLLGAPLVNLFGEIVGVYTAESTSGKDAVYSAIGIVAEQLEEVLEATQSNQST